MDDIKGTASPRPPQASVELTGTMIAGAVYRLTTMIWSHAKTAMATYFRFSPSGVWPQGPCRCGLRAAAWGFSRFSTPDVGSMAEHSGAQVLCFSKGWHVMGLEQRRCPDARGACFGSLLQLRVRRVGQILIGENEPLERIFRRVPRTYRRASLARIVNWNVASRYKLE